MNTSYFQDIPDWFCNELKDVSWRTRRWFDVIWNSPGVKRRSATRDHWMLVIVCKGENQIIHQGKAFKLNANQATILPPGHAHTQKTFNQSSLIARLPLVLLQERRNQPHPLRQFPLPLAMPLADPDDAFQRIGELQQVSAEKRYKSDAALLLGHHHTESLFFNAMAGAFNADVFENTIDPMTELINAIKFHMETEYQDSNLNITKLARDFQISRTDLQRRFAEMYQLPPKQWLHKYRTDIAARHISNHPELTIDAILKRCGYRSRSLFYTQFMQWQGCSPGEYRLFQK